MIYTVTFNPSLDYIVSVNHFRTGMVNRTEKEVIFPGGKGINVSMVLSNLGVESRALGFLAGFTGEEIRRRLAAANVKEQMIWLKNGHSRINVKLRSDEESEINSQGPKIREEALKELYGCLDRLKKGDFLVLAGSIPRSLPDTVYSEIMERIRDRGIEVIVDAAGDLLVNVLPCRPFLIKPNNHELGDIFGRNLSEKEEILSCARKLQQMGARNVLVSMAGDGAVMIDENGETYDSPAPEGQVIGSVGAGDSMVAGFLAGYLKTGSFREGFLFGVAAGSASAFSEGLADKETVEAILGQLKDTRLNGYKR